jgi:tight adherence protein C
MKLLISIFLAMTAGCFVRGVTLALAGGRLPSGDFLTKTLRGSIQNYLLPRHFPLLDRYIAHVTPIFEEVPMPPQMDFSLFLGVHFFAALIISATAARLLPARAWIIVLPVTIIVGGSVPYFWLLQQRSKLHNALLKAMPEWLELTALVMEAGLDLSAGIQQYLQKGTPGPLHTLLAGVQRETQMGRSRAEAIKTLSEKTSFAPLRDVCRSLVQALALGSSLAPLLREQGSALRTKRMQLAEKKAAEAPLKVLFPLFVFIVPTVFMVLFGPVAMMFLKGGF